MQTDLKIVAVKFRQVWAVLPYQVGVIMVAFTKKRFQEQNWLDNYPVGWQARKPGSKRNKGRAILVDTGRLRRGNRIISTTPNSVTVGNDTPYAAAHNYGFIGTVVVPAHIRKRFNKGKVATGKERMKTVKTLTGETQVKEHSKRMNLPRRQFMGESRYLSMQIKRLITAKVNSTFSYDR
ncbi:MAG: phage virion morphogenesis protein [Bacteroidota bacterium]